MLSITARLPGIFKDQLYQNSLFMVMSRFLNALAGFLFWVIAAKLYSVAEVGTATALISSLGLIMLLSRFGFDVSIIRFIENSDKNKAFSTSFVITTAASAVISLLYILFVRYFQATLTLSFIDSVLFILIALCNSIALITSNMFMALRKGQHLFIQTVLITLRILLLFPLAYLKDFGILLSLGICYALSVIFSIWILRKDIKFQSPAVDIPFVKETFRYTLESYISNLLTDAPSLILPIMVLYFVGQEDTAKFYIAMAIGNLTLIVPNSLSLSLFVEGSRGQPIKKNIFKVCASAYLFLLPVILVMIFWGKNILGFINKEYTDAYILMLFVIISSLFVVIYLIYMSVQNINMRVDRNILFNLIRFVLLLGISFYLISRFGINGVGFAWLLSHGVLSLLIAASYILTNKRIRKLPKITLTTGPVPRNSAARRLVIIILNTTDQDHEVKVAVNDLTAGRKTLWERSFHIKGNFTENLTLPRPPIVYEVVVQDIPPGVFIWASTINSSDETIDSNTYRHKDFLSIKTV